MPGLLSEPPSNGSYVTWRELSLKVDPLALQQKEMNDKLDSLILRLAGEDGERRGTARVRKSFLDSTRFWIGIASVFLAGGSGAIITVLWLKK